MGPYINESAKLLKPYVMQYADKILLIMSSGIFRRDSYLTTA